MLASPMVLKMKAYQATKRLTSTCRYCRYYQPQGRRGGMCEKLTAPVQGVWKACPLALPAFSPSWENLEDAWGLPIPRPIFSTSQTLAADLDHLKISCVKNNRIYTTQEAANNGVTI
ncbi:hypothetical protein [Dolichospermum sp. FACHB-1091]|uniref:hypothetical protein n=1 Tax=Dolichospermum sp. FACHB-1091 TaxID=2692798 RepID=UPI001F558913|nr:hypothetical protein [Dolichospermum sp. FACHB-1091]